MIMMIRKVARSEDTLLDDDEYDRFEFEVKWPKRVKLIPW